MGEPLYEGHVKIHSKGLLKKWKTAYIALHGDSGEGKCRMEIFKSKNDYDHDGIRSLYALRDLVSVKKMTNAQISSVLRLQKEESQLDLGFENEQDLQQCKTAISLAAFNKEKSQKATSPISLSKYVNEDPYDEPWDSKIIRVEVISNRYSNELGLLGHYEISTTENGLLLKVQRTPVVIWAFSKLYRIGVGDACLFLETTSNSVFEFVCHKVSRLLGQLQELMPLSCDNIDSIDDLPQQLSNRVYSRFYSVLPNLPVTLRKLETVPEESSARDFEQPKMDRTAKLPNGTEMRGSVNLTRINREYATGGFNGYPKPLETSSPVVRNHSNDSVNNLLRDSSEDVRAENDAFMTVEDEPDEVFIKSPGKLQSKLFGIFSGRKQSRNVSDTASVNSEQSVTRVRTDLGNSKGDRPKLGRNFFKRNSRNMEPSDNLSLQFDNSGGQKLLAGGNRRSFDDSDAGFNSSTEMSRNSARLSFRTAPTNTVWTGRTAMSRQDKSEFRPPEPVRLYRQVDTQPVPPEARTISPINRHTPFSYTHGLDELVTQQKSLSPASARRVFTNTTPAEKSKPPARPPPPEIVKKSVRFDTNFAPPQPPLRSKSKVVTFESSVFPPKRSDSLELIDSHAVGHILSGYTVNEEEENLLDEGKKKGSKGQKNTVV